MLADKDTLKLTVDSKDIVWYLNGDGMPHSSELVDCDFIKSPTLQNAKNVRMIGSDNNAELLHQLYELRLKRELALESIQICSPQSCETLEDKGDPDLVLFKLRNYNPPSSLGGWHEFGIKDFPSYLLAAHFKHRTNTCEYTRKVTCVHAAWPALSFIEGLDIDATSRLLAVIIDPRWVIDNNEVDSGDKFEQFLGINQRNLSEMAANDKSEKARLCRLALNCWKTESACPKITPSSPRNFLWRIWANNKGGVKGDLVATKFFVSYLRLTWTKAMCLGPQTDHLFVPKHFFSNQDEWEAYCEHEKAFNIKTN